jgi:hypothetical protein
MPAIISEDKMNRGEIGYFSSATIFKSRVKVDKQVGFIDDGVLSMNRGKGLISYISPAVSLRGDEYSSPEHDKVEQHEL